MGDKMKKRIIYLLIIILLLTGCTCEYNLVINGDTYSEEVILNGNNEESSLFNQKWQIPVDKDIYNSLSGDPSSNIDIDDNIYNYKLSGNKLLFNYDFSIHELNNSTAISNCYKTATVNAYQDRIILSTASEVTCFDKYPNLDELVINITVDRPVISHNADYKNGNIYTWNITRDNFSDKSINMILDNSDIIDNNTPLEDNNKNNIDTDNKDDYTLYIFCGILLLTLLLGYFIINKIKNREDNMDD